MLTIQSLAGEWILFKTTLVNYDYDCEIRIENNTFNFIYTLKSNSQKKIRAVLLAVEMVGEDILLVGTGGQLSLSCRKTDEDLLQFNNPDGSISIFKKMV